MTERRRAPRPLSLALGQIREDLAPRTVLAQAQTAWSDAVGRAIAAEAQPTSERGGVLTVSCSAAVWAHELDLMAPTIIERLNELLEGASIVRLRCVSVPLREV